MPRYSCQVMLQGGWRAGTWVIEAPNPASARAEAQRISGRVVIATKETVLDVLVEELHDDRTDPGILWTIAILKDQTAYRFFQVLAKSYQHAQEVGKTILEGFISVGTSAGNLPDGVWSYEVRDGEVLTSLPLVAPAAQAPAESAEHGSSAHVYHHYDRQPSQVKIKVERNTKGYNWEVSAEGATVDEAVALVRDADGKLRTEYGGGA